MFMVAIIEYLLGYLLLCIAYGTIFPWFLGWWAYIGAFFLGYLIGFIKSEQSYKKISKGVVIYIVSTPLVAVAIAMIELAFSPKYKCSGGLECLPGSVGLAIIHAFVMWAVVSFLFGAIIKFNKMNKPTYNSDDIFIRKQ